MRESIISASKPVTVLKMERENTGLKVTGNGKNAGDAIYDYFVTWGIFDQSVIVLRFRSKKFASATVNCFNHCDEFEMLPCNEVGEVIDSGE